MHSPSSPEHPRLPLSTRILISLLRSFFKLLYHQLAFSYDSIAAFVSVGAWKGWVSEVLPYLDGPNVLEIGFGPGHLQVQLERKGICAYGIDESPQMVKMAQGHLIKNNLPNRLVRGDALILPFKNECFHQVVMTFPAEFLLKLAMYAEVWRVLSHGGKVVLLPMAWITGRNPWERLIAWLNRITGEAPAWDEKVLEPLKLLGFDMAWSMLELHNSKVLLVQLFKSPINPEELCP